MGTAWHLEEIRVGPTLNPNNPEPKLKKLKKKTLKPLKTRKIPKILNTKSKTPKI